MLPNTVPARMSYPRIPSPQAFLSTLGVFLGSFSWGTSSSDILFLNFRSPGSFFLVFSFFDGIFFVERVAFVAFCFPPCLTVSRRVLLVTRLVTRFDLDFEDVNNFEGARRFAVFATSSLIPVDLVSDVFCFRLRLILEGWIDLDLECVVGAIVKCTQSPTFRPRFGVAIRVWNGDQG